MNSDYIYNSVATKALNKFSYRPYPLNEEPYFKLKSLNYHKEWDNIYKPYPIKDLKKVYHWSLPFNHGHYNEFEHLNTYSTHIKCGHARRFGSPSAGSGPRLYCVSARPFAAAGHDPGPG